jgi:hypothetical protein
MDEIHVYDKAKYHLDSVSNCGLPREHAYNHTTVFLRWLIENDLVGGVLVEDFSDELEKCRARHITVNRLYEIVDRCLASDMLSEQGNAFARDYFEFETGGYLADYSSTLQGDLPSELHVPFTEENYQKMSLVVDRRYSEWMKKGRHH